MVRASSLSMVRPALLLVCLFVLLTDSGRARLVKEDVSMMSDVIQNLAGDPSVLTLGLQSSTVTCTPTYGFLPCTTVIWGNLFLIVVYEYLLSLSQNYLTEGSELFFKMVGTEVFGGSMFQIIGTFPPVVILLVSGLTGTTSTAETLSAMGLAMLAGSAVMMLTLQWGAIVAYGSHDLSQVTTEASTATSSGTTKHFSLTSYGVTQDNESKLIARLMLIAMIPFVIIQLPQIVDSTTVTRIAVLVALIFSATGLIAYCIYQFFKPWIQEKILECIQMDFLKDNIFPGLLNAQGEADEATIEQLFYILNKNDDDEVSADELGVLFWGAQLRKVGLDEKEFIGNLMIQFDISEDNKISKAEFARGMKQLIKTDPHNSSTDRNDDIPSSRSPPPDEATQPLMSNTTKAVAKKVDKTWKNCMRVAYLLVLGLGITTLLAIPLMEAIEDFTDGLGFPSFIITYIIVPLAMGYKQVISCITSARTKNEKAVSLNFAMIYSGMFMNSMMCVSMFLLIVYVRDLTWNVSAGVLVVLIIGVIMGCLTTFRKTFPFWTCIMAFLLYPISLVLIYVLTTYCGWS